METMILPEAETECRFSPRNAFGVLNGPLHSDTAASVVGRR